MWFLHWALATYFCRRKHLQVYSNFHHTVLKGWTFVLLDAIESSETRGSGHCKYSHGERGFRTRDRDFPRSSDTLRAAKTSRRKEMHVREEASARSRKERRRGSNGERKSERKETVGGRRWRLPEIPRDVCVCPWKSAKEVSVCK